MKREALGREAEVEAGSCPQCMRHFHPFCDAPLRERLQAAHKQQSHHYRHHVAGIRKPVSAIPSHPETDKVL